MGWIAEDKGGGVMGTKQREKSPQTIATIKLTYAKQKKPNASWVLHQRVIIVKTILECLVQIWSIYFHPAPVSLFYPMFL